jgi:three-Cys-motif partner protein
MAKAKQQFGANWTEQKLECLKKYLKAYTTALKNQNFETYYIDAFAGTGYREVKQEAKSNELLFPELAEEESQKFLDGSARIALQLETPFSRYIFVEKSPEKCQELEALKQEHSTLSDSIEIINREANEYIRELCNQDWIGTNKRGVVFLDPFGMQVEWATIKAIADTKGMDLWLLFPLGIGVNRLLTKDGEIPDSWKNILNNTFGTTDWESTFYKEPDTGQTSLFDVGKKVEKVVNCEGIAAFFIDRLKQVFPGVAENPLILRNKCNNPIYLFCFAVGNPNQRAKELALKFANHILNKMGGGS